MFEVMNTCILRRQWVPVLHSDRFLFPLSSLLFLFFLLFSFLPLFHFLLGPPKCVRGRGKNTIRSNGNPALAHIYLSCSICYTLVLVFCWLALCTVCGILPIQEQTVQANSIWIGWFLSMFVLHTDYNSPGNVQLINNQG